MRILAVDATIDDVAWIHSSILQSFIQLVNVDGHRLCARNRVWLSLLGWSMAGPWGESHQYPLGVSPTPWVSLLSEHRTLGKEAVPLVCAFL